MGDLRIGNSVHSVATSTTGFAKSKGKTEKFANIFGNLGITFSTENTKLCQEEGVVSAKNFYTRAFEDLTNTPPFGKGIQSPFSYRG